MINDKAEEWGIIRRPIILFPDNNWAEIAFDKPPYRNKEGIWVKDFLLKPSPLLIKTYSSLRKKDVPWIKTDIGDCIWKQFATIYLHFPRMEGQILNPIIRYDLTYDDEQSYYSKLNEHYTSTIEHLMRQKDALLTQISILNKEKIMLISDHITFAGKIKEFNNLLGQKPNDLNQPETTDEIGGNNV